MNAFLVLLPFLSIANGLREPVIYDGQVDRQPILDNIEDEHYKKINCK